MFVDEASARESLVRMVQKLTVNRALRDDLLQEALLHLWLTEISRPGQTRSWYLQSCKFHLLHYLAAGRSVDSAKRRNGQTRLSEEPPSLTEFIEEIDSGESVFGLVSARDMIALLRPLLNDPERSVLECFADGLKLREIGRRLNISHTMVIRYRRKIASLLRRLEKPRWPKPVIRFHGSSLKKASLLDKKNRSSFELTTLPSRNGVRKSAEGPSEKNHLLEI
jgi:RNA polymerase sigma factor (sigma-70 family)